MPLQRFRPGPTGSASQLPDREWRVPNPEPQPSPWPRRRGSRPVFHSAGTESAHGGVGNLGLDQRWGEGRGGVRGRGRGWGSGFLGQTPSFWAALAQEAFPEVGVARGPQALAAHTCLPGRSGPGWPKPGPVSVSASPPGSGFSQRCLGPHGNPTPFADPENGVCLAGTACRGKKPKAQRQRGQITHTGRTASSGRN